MYVMNVYKLFLKSIKNANHTSNDVHHEDVHLGLSVFFYHVRVSHDIIIISL